MPVIYHMGGAYDNSTFKNSMNSYYYPLENMQKTVEFLKSHDNIDIATMEFGQYQPKIAPEAINAKGSKAWLQDMGAARLSLTGQPNATPLSKDEPDVVPLTKCALLDASVRKCFNSDPPICMVIDVTQQPKDAPNADQHDIKLVWDYAPGSDVPILLRLTMVCAFTPVAKAPSAS
jgi:hypothetical protein